MNICVLCNGFPTKKSAGSIFVVKLCEQWADQGHNINIIAPQSITKNLFRNLGFTSSSFSYNTPNGHIINVYRPFIITLGSFSKLKKISNYFRRRAISKVLKRIGHQDVYYGHFWNNGYDLYKAMGKYTSPLFVASGESVIRFKKRDEGFCHAVNGVVCVSTKNMEESINLGLISKNKCIVLPNAIDTNIFHKKDKYQCRQELGIDPNLFVVIYVGQFLHRKGYDRLADAINMLNDKEIGAIFLGKAKENKVPQCKGMIYQGFSNQKEISKYLNAADVFVLPTQAEGCCNAIVEAMACGLPIISSDLQFNYDILDNQNSLLIDPNNVEQIADAIKKIKNNKLLQTSLAENSLKRAQTLSLPDRAKKIINFINGRK